MLVVTLVRELNRVQSWSGATHVQKCVFFLRELTRVPVPYEFVIYHYGPFSFDLDDDLAFMRMRGWLEVESGDGYGVHYHPGPQAPGELPESVARFHDSVRWVAERFGKAEAKRLELLATSFYVWKRMGTGGEAPREPDVIAAVKGLKPHFSEAAIGAALQELHAIQRCLT